MPVVFFIDPELPREVKNITLSYTFFEIGGAVGTRAKAAATRSRPTDGSAASAPASAPR